ncbi:MAG: hypothetical protein ACRYGR_02430 [Janthinobacterium lividum]
MWVGTIETSVAMVRHGLWETGLAIRTPTQAKEWRTDGHSGLPIGLASHRTPFLPGARWIDDGEIGEEQVMKTIGVLSGVERSFPEPWWRRSTG